VPAKGRTAGDQDRDDPATERSHTDSNLLHRKFPLAITSAAVAIGGGAYPLR